MYQIARGAAGIFVGLILLCVLLYWPGLSGGFLFDDFPNIVDNPAIHVATPSWQAWLQAAWASPSSDLQRPLASLSFALNHYFAGLAPGPMKATNLVVHLLNGLLLFVLLRRMLSLDTAETSGDTLRSQWLALAVSAAWLLHPINLDAVLYVVQRMESLSQFFVLLGLIAYLDARLRQSRGVSGAGWRLWLVIPLCLLLGIAAKESAALLPVYALVLEFTVLRGVRRSPRQVVVFFTLFLLLPGMLGLVWMLPSVLMTEAWASRAFTLPQRLLTEPRVLMDYITWTLLPLPGFFSFYHDDYPISTGLLRPGVTLPAMLAIMAMAAGAWGLRQRRPLIALGLAWFLCAHALTATVFPLELAFNHRNYFASIGLLLAAFDLVLPHSAGSGLVWVRIGVVAGLIVLTAFSLALRAQVWGNPVLFAVTEAAQHPQSPRATYDLGRTYVALSNYRSDSPNLERAIAALEAAMHAPRASALPESALIMVASRTGRTIEPAWWASMVQKLRARAPTPEDAAAIKSLTLCQQEGRCLLDDRRMLDVYLSATVHSSSNPSILYSYAIFSQNRLKDTELAIRLARDAAQSADMQYQLNLVNFLIDLQNPEEARQALDALRSRARPGSMDIAIDIAQQRIDGLPVAPAPEREHP